jgi:Fe-S cluster assembly protein SufD
MTATAALRSKPFPYVERFAAVAATLPGADRPKIAGLRAAAAEQARRAGVPTQRVEPWRYTSLNRLIETAFEPASPAAKSAANDAARWVVPGSHRLVFVNGRAAGSSAASGNPPEGVSLTYLAEALAQGADDWASGAASSDHPFVALNTAFLTDGVLLRVARGVKVTTPIHLLFLGGGEAGAPAMHTRLIIRLEPGASVNVIEQHAASGTGIYWSNPVGDIRLSEGARLGHCKIIDEGAEALHIAVTGVEVAADAAYDSFVLTTGGALVRNEIKVTLDGEKAGCRLDGLYLGRDRQHIDNTSEIVHARPETTSTETYKGVLQGKSRAVFQGRIVVRPDAQKSNGRQINKTLLLSDQAEIDTKPELEIHADDVKCSHGAAVGEIDEDALFYLRTRGIAAEDGRRILVEAFAAELVDAIADPAAAALARDGLAVWLAGNAPGGAPEGAP